MKTCSLRLSFFYHTWSNPTGYTCTDAINHLVHNLPPLPSCELSDPHDDVTLPRLIEALQSRHRLRQMMLEEYSRAGARSSSFSWDLILKIKWPVEILTQNPFILSC